MPTTSIQYTVNTSYGYFRTLKKNIKQSQTSNVNFNEEISQSLTWISHKYTGSIRRGAAVIAHAYKHLRAVGMIWPPPLWIASACNVTSWILKRTARKFSSANTPCTQTFHVKYLTRRLEIFNWIFYWWICSDNSLITQLIILKPRKNYCFFHHYRFRILKICINANKRNRSDVYSHHWKIPSGGNRERLKIFIIIAKF